MKPFKLRTFLFLIGYFYSFMSVAQEEKKFNVLTAGNFDFSEKVKLNYLGHINFFIPDMNDSRLGINCGAMKINYSDTSQPLERITRENILLNPLKNPEVGDDYLAQLNKYKFTLKNSVWSNYFQLLWRLNSENADSKLYATLHGELLVSKLLVDYEYSNIAQDTMTIDSSAVNTVYRTQPSLNGSQHKTLYNWYIGGGITGNIRISDNGQFFAQGICGVTKGSTFFPNLTNYETLILSPSSKKSSLFYLFRFYYNHTLSNSVTGVVGADIRGIANADPQYALYIGLTVGIDKLFDALKDND